MTLNEAVQRGIERLRLPHWANADDHIKIDLTADGGHGPWVHFYSSTNELVGNPNPIDLLWHQVQGSDEWVPYGSQTAETMMADEDEDWARNRLADALSVLRTLEAWRAGQPAEMDEEAYARVQELLRPEPPPRVRAE